MRNLESKKGFFTKNALRLATLLASALAIASLVLAFMLWMIYRLTVCFPLDLPFLDAVKCLSGGA